jgi:hypothetical protein
MDMDIEEPAGTPASKGKRKEEGEEAAGSAVKQARSSGREEANKELAKILTKNCLANAIEIKTAMIKPMIKLKDMEEGQKELLKYWKGTIMKKGMDELISEAKYCRLKRTQKQEIMMALHSLTIEAEWQAWARKCSLAWKLEKESKIGPAQWLTRRVARMKLE